MSVVKEETTIPKEVLGILEDFKELAANELPNDLPQMRDKCQIVKAFNTGDNMITTKNNAFHDEAYTLNNKQLTVQLLEAPCFIFKKINLFPWFLQKPTQIVVQGLRFDSNSFNFMLFRTKNAS